MSNAPKFRKKAVEFEQLKQFDRAVASYVRAIEENENASEEVDVALFNKVGDLTLRQGRVTEAVTYYERAVEHYVTNGLFDNAIALCNKILRNAPGRSNVYFTLGRICGRKGLRTDATRNFLEYATRMQREGRVDEGMRALAEVADLMPELTEVGRLVEEHAARAGITLARRRATPSRGTAQTAAAEAPKTLFGMSKDLVFLDIDYDAPADAHPRTAPVATAVATPASEEIAHAAAQTVEQSDAPEAAETREAESADTDAIFPAPGTTHLEDLLIFDPNDELVESVHAHAVTPSVVDGTPILTPFVDLSIPLPVLDDFEPTEFHGTPSHTHAIATAESNPDFLHRGVSHKPDRFGRGMETPVVVVSIPTVPNFPAIPEPSASVNELPDEAGIGSSQLSADIRAESTEFATVQRAEIDANTEAGETDSANVSTDELNTAELVTDDVDPSIQNVETAVVADATFNAAILNDAVEQELISVEAVHQLDGLTADDEDDSVTAMLADVVDTSHVATSTTLDVPVIEASEPVLGLDLDGMLSDEDSTVAQVSDLEFEEFAPANDNLAAALFERTDDGAHSEDHFIADEELPPMIFPMPASVDVSASELCDVPADIVENDASGESYDDAFNATFDATFESTFDPEFDDVAYDVSNEKLFDVKADAASLAEEKTEDAFDSKPGSLHDAAYDAAYDATFDDAYDSTYDSTADSANNVSAAIVFIDDTDAPIDDLIDEVAATSEVRDEIATDDLEDLFEDADVPTATVAAEAALAATSRRDDLQNTVDSEPENWAMRRRLAEALFEAGDRAAAIAELNIALGGFDRAHAYTEASEIADELVRVAGEEVLHHQKRLELAIRLGDQHRLCAAYLDLADMLVRRGEDLRAKAVYARVLEIDPWDDRARTALGDAAPPAPPKPSVGPDSEHVDLAEWLRDDDEPSSTRMRMREPEVSGNEENDFNSLLRHFKEGVARSLGETDYDSHYDLGVAYKEMGLLDDAIGEFQKALRSQTYRLAAYEALGQCFLEQQSYKVAVTVLSRALHEPAFSDEQRVGVLYLLGYSCEELQRFDEARSYFQRVYATDIHFRDVAKRLADLERITR